MCQPASAKDWLTETERWQTGRTGVGKTLKCPSAKSTTKRLGAGVRIAHHGPCIDESMRQSETGYTCAVGTGRQSEGGLQWGGVHIRTSGAVYTMVRASNIGSTRPVTEMQSDIRCTPNSADTHDAARGQHDDQQRSESSGQKHHAPGLDWKSLTELLGKVTTQLNCDESSYPDQDDNTEPCRCLQTAALKNVDERSDQPNCIDEQGNKKN
jgi:hypothetical protein